MQYYDRDAAFDCYTHIQLLWRGSQSYKRQAKSIIAFILGILDMTNLTASLNYEWALIFLVPWLDKVPWWSSIIYVTADILLHNYYWINTMFWIVVFDLVFWLLANKHFFKCFDILLWYMATVWCVTAWTALIFKGNQTKHMMQQNVYSLIFFTLLT